MSLQTLSELYFTPKSTSSTKCTSVTFRAWCKVIGGALALELLYRAQAQFPTKCGGGTCCGAVGSGGLKCGTRGQTCAHVWLGTFPAASTKVCMTLHDHGHWVWTLRRADSSQSSLCGRCCQIWFRSHCLYCDKTTVTDTCQRQAGFNSRYCYTFVQLQCLYIYMNTAIIFSHSNTTLPKPNQISYLLFLFPCKAQTMLDYWPIAIDSH